MANYNVDYPRKRGFWYDVEICRKRQTRTARELYGNIRLLNDSQLNNCRIMFVDEVLMIELPKERRPLIASPSQPPPALRNTGKSGPSCRFCKDDENKRTAGQSSDQKLTNNNRALALNCHSPINEKGAEAEDWRQGKPVRVVRNMKGGKHSKYAPAEGNRYDGIYKVVKYWPERGKSGFLVWRYLLRRDDTEPEPWTREGKDRTRQLGLTMQYPEGYLEALANKEKSRKRPAKALEQGPSSSKTGKSKQKSTGPTLSSPRASKKSKLEPYTLSEQQANLIKEDKGNAKLWDDVLTSLQDGPYQIFLSKVKEAFQCICCQELVFRPVTTVCQHNVCKDCLDRSFRAQVFSCPACRFELDHSSPTRVNQPLQTILNQLFPGYGSGR